jgi:hypothetical protein
MKNIITFVIFLIITVMTFAMVTAIAAVIQIIVPSIAMFTFKTNFAVFMSNVFVVCVGSKLLEWIQYNVLVDKPTKLED